MARGRKVGDLFVEISAQDAKLEQGLDSAKAKTEKASAEMGGSVSKNINKSLGETGEKIKDATSGIRSVVGSLTAALGVVTRIFGVASLIVGVVVSIVAYLKSAREEVERAAAATRQANQAFGQSLTASARRRDDARAILEAGEDEVRLAEERLEIQKRYRSDDLRAARESVEASEKVLLVDKKIAEEEDRLRKQRYSAGLEEQGSLGFRLRTKEAEETEQRLNELYRERAAIIEQGTAPERQRLDDEIAAAEDQVRLAKQRREQQRAAATESLRATTDELNHRLQIATAVRDEKQIIRLSAEIERRAAEERAKQAEALGENSLAASIRKQADELLQARLSGVDVLEQAEREAQNRLAREREEALKREAQQLQAIYEQLARAFAQSIAHVNAQFNSNIGSSVRKIEKAVDRLASRQQWEVVSRY